MNDHKKQETKTKDVSLSYMVRDGGVSQEFRNEI